MYRIMYVYVLYIIDDLLNLFEIFQNRFESKSWFNTLRHLTLCIHSHKSLLPIWILNYQFKFSVTNLKPSTLSIWLINTDFLYNNLYPKDLLSWFQIYQFECFKLVNLKSKIPISYTITCIQESYWVNINNNSKTNL